MCQYSREDIEKLSSKINDLEERLEELSSNILRLSLSKVDDPRYPFWNWLLKMNFSESNRCLLDGILSILNARLKGQEVPDIFKKQVPGISMDILYSDKKPSYAEMEEIINRVFSMNKKHLLDILIALHGQGLYEELCVVLLSEIGIELTK